MDRFLKHPKGVPEDFRHKILYERTHVAKYSGVVQRHHHRDALREIRDLPLWRQNPQQLPNRLPLNLYPCGDLGYLAVPELV